jgi:hypothetical protein
MLRKPEQDVFPQKWSQVHRIIVRSDRVLSIHGHKQVVGIQLQGDLEGLQAAGAFAGKNHQNASPREEGLFEALNLQVDLDGMSEMDQFVLYFEIKIRSGDLSSYEGGAGLQLSKSYV